MANRFVLEAVLTAALALLLTSNAVELGDADIPEDDGQYRDDPFSTSTAEPLYPDGVNTIPGDAEIHYPVYEKIFKTSFSCSGRLAGFYADIDARCQIWHICDVDGRMQSFLCTNGTIFSQETRVCEWWYNTNCDANFVKRNYEHNKELYKTYKETDLLPESEIESGDRSRSGKKIGHQVLQQAPKATSRPQEYPLHQRSQQPPVIPTSQVPQRAPSTQRPQQFRPESNLGNLREAGTNQRPAVAASPSREQNKPEIAQRALPSQAHLSREELEQRRQAARDEFYSIPAKLEQAKRISQQRQQEQQRNEQQQRNDQQRQQEQQRNDQQRSSGPPVHLTTLPPFRPNADAEPPKGVTAPATQAELTPKQKFRHSTPRKHNVYFRPTVAGSGIDDEERQIPEESKRKAFPPFGSSRAFIEQRKGLAEVSSSPEALAARKAPEAEQYTNSYLPTSNEPVDVKPTVPDIPLPEIVASSPVPKIRKRKRRPIQKPKPTVDARPAVPLPNLSYRPPLPDPTPTVLPTKSLELLRTEEKQAFLSKSAKDRGKARVVIKRKFRNNHLNRDDDDAFPGNPHLEQTVENEFKQAHAAQKRCAVVGSGSTYKVLC